MDCSRSSGLPAVDVRAGQEVGADHLQAVAAGPVRAQHQSCRLDRLLDNRDLTLVDLEVDQLRGSSSLPVSSFSTSLLNSSFGICRALCIQVALSKR